jgi:hypothetical protein
VVAIDDTKLVANASREASLDYERIAREILAEARATDEAEDELYGEARGDELPAQLRTREGAGDGFQRPSASWSPGRPRTDPRRLPRSLPTSLP